MIEVMAIDQLPLLKQGDDIAALIVARAEAKGIRIQNRDILVVGQKAVSKTEGRVVDITLVKPSRKALKIARKTGKRPEFVEVVLRDSSRVVRADKAAFIVTTKAGVTCLNGGVDKSNVSGNDMFALLPLNPDASARRLMKKVKTLTGKRIGVVVCDTRSRPFRRGQVEECIGVAGLNPLVDYRGQKDLFGYTLRFKNVALADEVASAAELVMGQGTEAAPAAIVRGVKRVKFPERTSSRRLGVLPSEDLFRGTL